MLLEARVSCEEIGMVGFMLVAPLVAFFATCNCESSREHL